MIQDFSEKVPAFSIHLSKMKILLLNPLSAFLVAINFLIRGQASISGYSVDDYAYISNQIGLDLSNSLRDGRFVQVLSYWIIQFFGLNFIGISFLLTVLAISIQALFISVTIQSLFPNLKVHFQILGGGLVLCHPYWTELFTFKLIPLTSILMYVGLIVVLLINTQKSFRKYFSTLISSFVIFLLIALYQTVIMIILALILGVILSNLTERTYGKSFPTHRGNLGKTLFISLSLGLTLYFIFIKLAPVILGQTLSGRTKMITIDEIPNRINLNLEKLQLVFWGDEGIFPFASKLFFFILLLLCFYTILFKLLIDRKWVHIIILGTTIFFIPVIVLGTLWLTSEWWPAPRVLQQVGLIYGLFFLASTQLITRTFLLKLLSIIAIFSILIGASLSNQILSDQNRMNSLDWATSIRIISQLEAINGFENVETLIIEGGLSGYSKMPRSVQMDLNASAFSRSWSKIPVIENATGYSFVAATDSELKLAKMKCNTSNKWPDKGSVYVMKSLALVCMRN